LLVENENSLYGRQFLNFDHAFIVLFEIFPAPYHYHFSFVIFPGDLFFNAADVTNSQQWQQFAANVPTGLQNRNKVLCAANYIVPGHGPMFQVTASMKTMASCGSANPGTTGKFKNKLYSGSIPSYMIEFSK
jgi:hypothetical protein